MVEFKAKADKIIKERLGIEVEHIRSKWTFESRFYSAISDRAKSEFIGRIRGWPLTLGSWCARDLKVSKLIGGKDCVNYVGIASDEPNRFNQLSDKTVSPLVESGWDEAYCRRWCEQHGLLSPIYTTAARGGCWFCPKQPAHQLRLVRKNYPELWALMLKWDKDSPVTFKADGHTVHDFDRRFQMEDEGLIYPDDKVFRKRIFEGDKVKGFNDLHQREEVYDVMWECNNGFYFVDDCGTEWHPEHIIPCEVIGTVFDEEATHAQT